MALINVQYVEDDENEQPIVRTEGESFSFFRLLEPGHPEYAEFGDWLKVDADHLEPIY